MQTKYYRNGDILFYSSADEKPSDFKEISQEEFTKLSVSFKEQQTKDIQQQLDKISEKRGIAFKELEKAGFSKETIQILIGE